MIMLTSHGRETLTTWDATPTTQEFYNWNKDIIQEVWDAPNLQSQVQYHNTCSNPRWVGERQRVALRHIQSDSVIYILCNIGDVEPKYVLVDSTKVLLTEMDNLASDICTWLQERIPLIEKQWYLPVDSGICFLTNTDIGQCAMLHDDFNVKQVPIDIADGVYVAPLVDFVYPPKEFCFLVLHHYEHHIQYPRDKEVLQEYFNNHKSQLLDIWNSKNSVESTEFLI